MNATFKPLLFLALILPISGFGQLNELEPCATRDGKSDWLIQYQQNPDLFPNLEDTLYVPLTIHLVGDDAGFGYFNFKLLLEIICRLNQDFEESAIQFYIKGDINYIANSTYNNHTFGEGAQMMQEYKVENTINCYIVDDPAGACGYSSYNLGVALAEQCIGPNDHTWAHELGHYLSLPHTFWGWEGYSHDYAEPAPVQIGDRIVERVDGTNCSVAGDGFCDTPPDYLNFRWQCPSSGYSTTEQHDPVGAPFFSDGTFFMSYAGDNCMNRFSAEQIAAMRANMLTEKLDFLDQDIVLGPVSADPFYAISPEDGALINNYNTILFEWEPVPDATHYFIEISPFSNFTLVLFKDETTENSVVFNDIPPNYTLYWRVRPYNSFYTCEEWSEGLLFTTENYTSVNELQGLQELNLSPVPLSSGESLRMEFQLDMATDLQIEMLDVSGSTQAVYQRSFNAGFNVDFLPTNNLAPGIYVLRLKGVNGSMSRKVVIAR